MKKRRFGGSGSNLLTWRTWALKPWYQKTESLRRGASQKLSEGARGSAGPPPGGLGGWKPPSKSCRGSGGRQPPSKNCFFGPCCYPPGVGKRALATYLIPGCVGRGVRLGSESSSATGGGVWKSGDLEIWEFGDLGIWRSGDLEIQKFGDLGTWKFRNSGAKKSKRYKFSKSKSVLPKMSARSGLVGKNPPGPIWGHLRQFVP